jgi:hypothetical protein
MPAGLPGDGSAAGHAAVSALAGGAGQDSSRSSHNNSAGPPGRDHSPASQPSWLTRSRKVTMAIVLVIAAGEVALGLIFTHPRSPQHPGLVPRGLISFEDGTDGWQPLFGSIRSARTTQVAYSGSHALLITARSTYSAVGVETGLAGLRPGDKVTFHIYSDGQAGGSVLPFAERWNQPEDLADNVRLPSHPGWFTVTWVVPAVSEVDAIGIQVVQHGSGQLTLAIDALTWPGS